MIDICLAFADEFMLSFNPSKSVFKVFGDEWYDSPLLVTILSSCFCFNVLLMYVCTK